MVQTVRGRGVDKVLSVTYLTERRWTSADFNIITAFVSAEFIAISEFFDARKIEKF